MFKYTDASANESYTASYGDAENILLYTLSPEQGEN